MKRLWSLLLVVVTLAALLCACGEESPSETSDGALQNLSLFEPLGIPLDLLEQCSYQTLSDSQGEYFYQEGRQSLTVRHDADNRIIYLLYTPGEPAEEDAASPEELMAAAEAIREACGAGDYRQRTDLWPLYTDGDDSVTLEYTMRYGDVWNYQESMAFRLDLEQGILTEFAWKNAPPVSAEWTATQEDALSAAEDWIANEKYLPLAEAQVLLPSALAEATDPRVDSVFLDGSPAYLVQYTIEMPWNPAAFQGKELPEEPITYGIWVSGTDGQALQDGIITEFFAEKTALPYL